jgi:phosphoglycolate phosphatase-like HAD superfamily hydrolase
MTVRHCPVWFDIDGTLVHTSVGKDAFRIALQEIYGWEDSFESVRFAGNTDLRVLMDFSEQYAGSRTTALDQADAFFERMAELLDEGLQTEKPEVIPGAKSFLEVLAEQQELGLYLLTGNARACAFHKLRHADLHHSFQDGGFGDEHDDRNVLAKRSRDRVLKAFRSSDPGWVIGDTPRDIQAAQTIGAKSIGVASGAYSSKELLAAGATHVLPDLTDAEHLLSRLMTWE